MSKKVWVAFSIAIVALNFYLAFQLYNFRNNAFYDVKLSSKFETIKFPLQKRLVIFLLTASKSSCRYRTDNFFWQEIKKIAKEKVLVKCIKMERDNNFKNRNYCDTIYTDKGNRFFSKFSLFLPAVVILNSKGKVIFVSSVPAEKGYQKGLLLIIKKIVTDYLKIQKIRMENKKKMI